MSDKTDFQHESDCPCFGDEVEHSIDCKNCTCDKSCKLPPEGWVCSRGYGHEGPCAARPRKLYENPSNLGEKCFVCGDTRVPEDGLCRGCDYPKDAQMIEVGAMEIPIPEDLNFKSCCRCGAILSKNGDHRVCRSCWHTECSECPVYVPEPTYEELKERIAKAEQQLQVQQKEIERLGADSKALLEALKGAKGLIENDLAGGLFNTKDIQRVLSEARIAIEHSEPPVRAALSKPTEGRQ